MAIPDASCMQNGTRAAPAENGGTEGDSAADSGGSAPSPGRHRALLLLDERPFMLECLASWLKANAREFEIVAAGGVEAALAEIQGTSSPALILLSLSTFRADDDKVHAIVARLQAAARHIPIVILSDMEKGEAARSALQLGARGYIPTSESLSVMIAALRLVVAGGIFIPMNALAAAEPAAEAREVVAHAPPCILDDFTPREMQVLTRLHHGKANKIIAHELAMSESTVKVHVRRIMQKLHATNRAQVAYAVSQIVSQPVMGTPIA